MRRHDRNEGVRAFVDGAQGWWGLLVVNISGVLEEDLLETGEGDLQDRDGASVEDPSVDLFYEGLCRRPAGDQDLLPLLPRPSSRPGPAPAPAANARLS